MENITLTPTTRIVKLTDKVNYRENWERFRERLRKRNETKKEDVHI